MGSGWERPALLTMTSRRPVSATARSTRARTWAGSRTSVVSVVHDPPAASMAALVASMADCVRPQMATWAPAAPSRSAMARPMPLDAPVTTAVFPDRS